MDAILDTVLISFDEETGIGRIRMNRPDSLNALDKQLREDIITGLARLDERNETADGVAVRAVILDGVGENFSAGADLHESPDHSPARTMDRSHRDVLLDFPAPVVAAVRGYCLGGGFETAMSCDFRLVHVDSRLGLPEIDLGIMPGGGGVQFISRLANPSIAKELAMTGKHISAERARELGLVNRVFDDEDFDEGVTAFAETLASKPPLAIQAIKDAANMAVQTGLREARQYDGERIESLRESADARSAKRAWRDDGFTPSYQGR